MVMLPVRCKYPFFAYLNLRTKRYFGSMLLDHAIFCVYLFKTSNKSPIVPFIKQICLFCFFPHMQDRKLAIYHVLAMINEIW